MASFALLKSKMFLHSRKIDIAFVYGHLLMILELLYGMGIDASLLKNSSSVPRSCSSVITMYGVYILVDFGLHIEAN